MTADMLLLQKPFDAQQLRLKKRSLRKILLEQDNLVDKRIAILSGSTIGEIKPILELFLLQNGIRPIFYEGDYHLFFEESVFDNPELREFKPDLIYVHTSVRNISDYPHAADSLEIREKRLEGTFSHFKKAWLSLKNTYACPVIVNDFEALPYRIMGNADGWHQNGRNHFIHDLNTLVYAFVSETPGFYLNDINYLASRYGMDRWFDQSAWYLYKYAMALDAIPEICFNISLIIKSIYGKNKKALVLDLDNTLWGGVIGDDGVENIKIGIESPVGMAYSAFQEYVKSVSELGIMLNVCSKNEEENAKLGFTHPSSHLKIDDFQKFKANWLPKSDTIQEIVRELNIGLDSVVFVDDNPTERDLVHQYLPEVSVPVMSSPENYIRDLDSQGYFEITALSSDDLQRNETYRQNAARASAEASFVDYDDFLKSLEMKNHVGRVSETTISRVTQLINKTNQFNFTTRRYTEDEIRGLIQSEEYILLWGRLEDKFGDNGIVTALIASISGARAIIDLWVMSCRVFKRNLEYSMFDCLVKELKKKGVKMLIGQYRETKKNIILKNFYSDLGFVRMDSEENDYMLKLENYKERSIESIEVIQE